MVTLGRVLAAGPEVLVVDELSQGLAPILVRRLFTALEEAAKTGVGIILVEQHARLAIGIADRVLVMRRGSSSRKRREPKCWRIPKTYRSYTSGTRVTSDRRSMFCVDVHRS